MGKVIDITGNKYGRLTVESYAGIRQHRAAWNVVCECGNKKVVDGVHLRKGNTVSCGCYKPNKKSRGEAAFNDLYRRYRADAKRKKREFTLTIKQVRDITSAPCIYCGQLPYTETSYKEAYNGQYTYNGIDRVDNNRGYVIDNVAPACGLCNKMKGQLTHRQFIDHITLIYTRKELSYD